MSIGMPAYHTENADLFCRKCGKTTAQSRTVRRSVWLFTWIFGVATLGIGFVVVALVRAALGVAEAPWICSVCRRSPPKISRRPQMLLAVLFLGGLAACIALLQYLRSRG